MKEMNMNDMLHGKLVHLTAENPEVMAKNFSHWNQDAGWVRYLDSDPSRLLSEKKWQELLEKDLEKGASDEMFFAIRDLESDVLIGFIGLFDLYKAHGDTLVVIALGERKSWGNGYGTDAMRVMLRYAFTELNLRKVGLIVFEYNPRAIRSYEKVGFTHEGRVRGAMQRDGKRWDYLYMGILRDEWLANGIRTS
jgi:RimJ/RimL family protein N-acetyltransferase